MLLASLLIACSQSPAQGGAVPPSPLVAAKPASQTPIEAPALLDRERSWIEVDLAAQNVILHNGGTVVAKYPASSGLVDDPDYATPPGLYRVQMMEKGPIENVPGVFVSDILIFDFGRGLGIHSRPMDAGGNLLDATLGRPGTAGCVRVAESASVYAFAWVGMQIWIH